MSRSCFLNFMASSLPPALFEAVNTEAMFSNGHQLGHQQTHHAIQKAAGLDFHADEIARTVHRHLLDRCSGMGPPTACTHECRKVVQSHHSLQGGLHPQLIQSPLVTVPAPRAEKQIRASSVVDRVAIAPVPGRVAGMPRGRHQHRFAYAHAGG